METLLSKFQSEWKSKNEFEIDDVHALEDCLGSYNVFLNGISNEPCHPDSYMTIVDFANLKKAIKEIDAPKSLMELAINYWITNPNNQPPLRLVALTLERGLV